MWENGLHPLFSEPSRDTCIDNMFSNKQGKDFHSKIINLHIAGYKGQGLCFTTQVSNDDTQQLHTPIPGVQAHNLTLIFPRFEQRK